MPADIVGTNVVQENEQGDKFLDFQPGPIFANVILADEINRATPKTQSALLEAMQEKTVTVGKQTYALELPFVVLATLNPLELEATYPLPEAQLVGGKVRALLGGRSEVGYEDIRHVAMPALRHRVILNFEGEAERIDPDIILKAIIDWVPEKR